MVDLADNESVLIANLKQGERQSFDILVNLYQQRGLNIAYNFLGNLEDAKDVLQEAFVKVYLNIKGFESRSKFSTWFYRIVLNCSLDFLRKKKRTARFLESLTDEEEVKERQIPDSKPDPAKAAIDNELASDLNDCISCLPKNQKECFVLKHQNGLSVSEISQVLKCRPSTVKVHLFRAVHNLRKCMSKNLSERKR